MAGLSEYQIHTINLAAAGQIFIPGANDYLAFIEAVDNASGVIDLDASVEVAFGRQVNDFAPFYWNNRVRGAFDGLTVRWQAHPSTIKLFLARSVDRGGLEIEAPPSKQIVTQAIGTSLVTTAVVIGTSATLLAAASASRQSVLIQNVDADGVYIGGPGVTTANGLILAPGDSVVFDKNTGAIWGIALSNRNVRVAIEA